MNAGMNVLVTIVFTYMVLGYDNNFGLWRNFCMCHGLNQSEVPNVYDASDVFFCDASPYYNPTWSQPASRLDS